MGISVLVDGAYEGMLYKNEVFQRVREGQKLTGYVKFVREDGKLDISLEWGKWHDDAHGVTLMLPCWNSQNVHAGPHSTSGESHLDFDPLGVTFWGVTCWAEQAGQWPLDEHARPTTDQLP